MTNAAEVVYFGLGANLGDRRRMLERAAEELRELSADGAIRVSSWYETEPWGEPDQPWFMNGAARLTLTLTPADALQAVKEIELRLGRVPGARWGPRIIDLDVLLFGSRIIRDADLTIPHSQLLNRRFALAPLAEIDPDVAIPGTGLSAREALEAGPDRGRIRRLEAQASKL